MNRLMKLAVAAALVTTAGAVAADVTVKIPSGGAAATQDVGSTEPFERKDPTRAKVTAGVRVLYDEYQAYLDAKEAGEPVGEFISEQTMAMLKGESVVVDTTAAGDASVLAAKLESLGMSPVYVYGRMVSGVLPIEALPAAEALTDLHFMRLSAAWRNVGAVTSQGDGAMKTDDVRATFGVDGTGVTVGVLSDSFDCTGVAPVAADDVASGDLPAGVTVLSDLASGCIDEGRAMLQLIHDVAPGADLAFASAFIGGQAGFATAILDLADSAGPDSDVIVDDIIYFAEPMHQDGVIAQAADEVTREGRSYFSSAGNNDREGYQAPYIASGVIGPNGGDMHDFDPGAGTDTRLTITQSADTFYVLNWQDPHFTVSGGAGALNDVDICFYFPVGATDPFACNADFNTGGDPIEIGEIVGAGDLEISIELFSGPGAGLMTLVTLGSIAFGETYDGIDGPTSYGHANAAGAIAVGAAAYFETPDFGVSPPLLEGFSSSGGIPILFDLDGDPQNIWRQKPEITAPDGTDTTFFGSDIEPNGFPNFFGTSAAAPHAAAMAALMLEVDPALTPDQILAAMKRSGVDILGNFGGDVFPAGFDSDSGSGLIEGMEAVRSAGGTFDRIVSIDDQNTNGSRELVTMVQRTDNDRIRLYAKDSDTDVTLWSRLLPTGFSIRGVTNLGSGHLLAQLQRDSDGRVSLQTISVADGSTVYSRFLPSGFSTGAVAGLDTDKVVTLRKDDATRAQSLEVRDAFDGSLVRNNPLAAGQVLRGMVPISTSEVVILSWWDSLGSASLDVWNVLTGTITGTTVSYPSGWLPLGLTVVDSTDVCAVFRQGSNDRLRLRCNDAFAGTTHANTLLPDGTKFIDLESSGTGHVSVSLFRLEDARTQVQVRNPADGAFIANLLSSSNFAVSQHTSLPDTNTNGSVEEVLFRMRNSDRVLSLQVMDWFLATTLNIVPQGANRFAVPEQ